MLKLIRPKTDAAVFLLDGLVCTWVQNGHILNALQPISSLALIEVDRLSLKALELHGPVPFYGPETPLHQPDRTIASHFAVHRP